VGGPAGAGSCGRRPAPRSRCVAELDVSGPAWAAPRPTPVHPGHCGVRAGPEPMAEINGPKPAG